MDSKLRVLIVSDGAVETRKGELFHCLAGSEKVWHTGPEDALNMYQETIDDGWDTVIIDCKVLTSGQDIAVGIREENPEQRILLLHDAFTGIRQCLIGLYVPRKGEMLGRAFGEFRVGGSV